MTLLAREGQTKEDMKRTGWNLREEGKVGPLFDVCPNLALFFPHECYYLEL